MGPPLCGTTIVRWGDPANSLEVLGSRRGYRHCRAMYAALQHRVFGVLCQRPTDPCFSIPAPPSLHGGAFYFPPCGRVVIWRHEYGKTGFHCPGRNSCPCTGLLPFPWCTATLTRCWWRFSCLPVYGQAGESGDPCSVCPGLHPEEMAPQDVEAVREIVRPCGLSARKASAIVHLSRILVEKYEGKVPCDFAALESLPGWGIKRLPSSWFRPLAFPPFRWIPTFFRLSRLWGLSTGKTVETVERDLKSLFPEKSWGDLHLRIVLYGREYCPARGCGGRCPICSRLARESGCEGV